MTPNRRRPLRLPEFLKRSGGASKNGITGKPKGNFSLILIDFIESEHVSSFYKNILIIFLTLEDLHQNLADMDMGVEEVEMMDRMI